MSIYIYIYKPTGRSLLIGNFSTIPSYYTIKNFGQTEVICHFVR